MTPLGTNHDSGLLVGAPEMNYLPSKLLRALLPQCVPRLTARTDPRKYFQDLVLSVCVRQGRICIDGVGLVPLYLLLFGGGSTARCNCIQNLTFYGNETRTWLAQSCSDGRFRRLLHGHAAYVLDRAVHALSMRCPRAANCKSLGHGDRQVTLGISWRVCWNIGRLESVQDSLRLSSALNLP